MIEVRDLSSSAVHIGPVEGRAVRMPGAQLVTRKVSSEQTGGATHHHPVLQEQLSGREGDHTPLSPPQAKEQESDPNSSDEESMRTTSSARVASE